MKWDVVIACKFNRSHGKHLGTGTGHFEHLVEVHLGELASLRHNARVGSEYPGDVGVNLTRVGSECLSECGSSEVGRASTHRGDFLVGADALEARDDRNLPLGNRSTNAVALDFNDLGLAMCGVGNDADLAARVADGVDATISEGHRE